MPVPKVGEIAPDFELPEASERTIRLSEEASKRTIVLAFYPTDWGMNCTMEMKRFMELQSVLEDLNAAVLAISTNTTTSHRSWKEHLGITFPLLSDPEGEVVKRYDLMLGESDLMRGRSTRAVLVIGQGLKVHYSWKAPDQAFHPDYDAIVEACRKVRTSD